ncbi:MAG: gliding motility-associated C-terminal domain-containing protein, partial [Bacteroidia bacterium]|nr:gliding motility-associated C-terminal domain-containing protein [Bacteroidia bacterium]
EGQSTVGYVAPSGLDTDNDGLDDSYDITNGGSAIVVENTDGADFPDYLDRDSDNDALPDIVEVGHGADDTDADGQTNGVVGINGLDDSYDDGVAGDTFIDVNGALDDTQTDNFPDADGDVLLGGDVDYRDATFNDNDGDGISDVDDLDDDNDGIVDTEESGGSDPLLDSDLDNIPNYQDADYCALNAFGVCANLDGDNDGIPNHLDTDSDNDGCPDALEGAGSFTAADLTSSNNLADSDEGQVDAQGIPEDASMNTQQQATTPEVTDSTLASGCDADGDGVLDATEIANGTNPNDPCSYNVVDITVAITSNADCDGDGVLDVNEIASGTDPFDSCSYNIADITEPITSTDDCDGDGVTNADEAIDGTDPLDDCSYVTASITVAVTSTADCDGDGVTNDDEAADGTDGQDPCSFVLASQTVAPSAAWNAADCDGDGVTNGDEVTDGTDPLDDCSYVTTSITVTVTSTADCDGDGVINADEAIDGTDPFDECSYNVASITVAITSMADCDGDGALDVDEVGSGTDPFDACDYNVSDITVTNTAGLDCDGDGVLDATELSDGTDPQYACSYLPSSITEPVTNTEDCTALIEVTKIADLFGGNEEGDTIDYTIYVENIGNVTITDISLIDTFMDINGNPLTLTSGPTFSGADMGSPEGTLVVGEIATYTATFVITQEAIIQGGVSNQVLAMGVAPNFDIIDDTSDDGDDFDGNSDDDSTITNLGCMMVFNEFSPNGDGVNDTLVINCIQNYPNNKLQIYNRWGNLVYTANGYQNDWDGTSNARAVMNQPDDLPIGTYYYILDFGDGSKPRTGWIYINR